MTIRQFTIAAVILETLCIVILLVLLVLPKEAMIQAFGWYIQMIPDYWELPKEYDLEKGITAAEEWLEAIKDVPSEKGQI